MEDPMVLLSNLKTTHERYNRLQGLYNEFCAQILNLRKEDDRLAILSIEQSGNTLTVNYLDRIIEANYLFSVDDNGGQKGYVYCQLLSPTKDNMPMLIEKFSFNGQGTTDISSKNDNDPYMINDHNDAVTILLNWASISVKENF